MSEKTIKDGGPAFPTEPNTQPGFYAHHGMSLRDWFAGQAMASLVSSDKGLAALVDLEGRAKGSGIERVSIIAYRLADAMLAARSLDPNGEGA